MDKHFTRRHFLGAAALTLPVVSTNLAFGQDAREALGTKINKSSKMNKGPHPLQILMEKNPAALRAEFHGVHPRVFTTNTELETLRHRAKSTHKELWQKALTGLVAMNAAPAETPAQTRRHQNTTAIGIVGAAFAYQIEGEEKYLAAAKRYMDAAVSYPVWGYFYSKPNIDLAAGHLLYGLGAGYDLLFNVLNEEDRARYRDKLIHHARLVAEHFMPKPGKSYSYSQNHCYIPIAGLAVAAYALWDDVPEEAARWAALARAIFTRVLDVASPDGYFYEGIEYWVFSMPWMIHGLDAFAHAAGDDMYDHPGLRQSHLYLAHTVLPNGHDVFDFGDVFEGPVTRARIGADAARTHPNGKLHSNYNLLYRLAGRFDNADAQGVAQFMSSQGQICAEDFWSLQWLDPKVAASPMSAISPYHHFTDLDTVFWRSDWTTKATAFAFRAGPPEGHHITQLIDKMPDAHLSMGHSHPDAGSFILYGGGSYLTGQMGYAGIPSSKLSNTLLIDGQGQANEGGGHDAFVDYPYERLNRIRITSVNMGKDHADIVADLTGAYRPELGVEHLERRLSWARGVWTTTDQMRASKPVVLTSQVHGDTTITQVKKDSFSVDGKPTSLQVDIRTSGVKTNVTPGIIITPGPPGSVDKGSKEQRGTVLNISLLASKKAKLITKMTF